MINDLTNYFYSLESHGIKLGLSRTHKILEACDNPHTKIDSIQVIGTNGKGSTCAMIANILKHAGYKVGLYTSPHLNKLNERIRINGQCIDDNSILSFIKKYDSYIREFSISFFEVMTALATWYFHKNKVDISILETGLGGRLDSVSACNSKILIFTEISLDHQHILGHSIEKIAQEKAGAIQKKSICLSAIQQDLVTDILNQQAEQFNIKIEYIKSTENHPISLNGQHQLINQTLAVACIKHLKNLSVHNSDIRLGLSNLKWPGRVQKIFSKPSIFFDVAHNETSFLSLYNFVKNFNVKGKLILILALQKNKNISSIIKYLVKIFNIIILTQTNTRNYLPAKELQQVFGGHKTIIIKDPYVAVEKSKQYNQDDCVMIAGSHYLGPMISNIFKISFEKI